MFAAFLFRLKNLLLNPWFVLTVWCLTALDVAIKRMLTHGYNNFLVFRGVFDHLFASLPLYEPYPLEYGDLNHYGPIFGFIIAPFAVMPPAVGVVVWVMAMSLFLYWAVRRLPLPVQMTSLVLLLSVNDLFGAGWMQQFNIVVAALLVGSLVMIQRRREGWAALFIVIGAMTKIYGIVGLAFFFFVDRKWRFVGCMALWSAVALLLPLLVVSPEYLLSQYQAWAVDILEKNGQNMFCEYTNISFLGAMRKLSGSAVYSDLWFIGSAMAMFLVSYLRIGQYKRIGFRLTMLASLLLFIVLFSSGSEKSGYIIATVGVGIWWVTLPRRGWLEWLLLVAVLVASFSHNIFPRSIYKHVIDLYALRALPYTAVWLHCTWRLWREDFAASYPVTNGGGADADGGGADAGDCCRTSGKE